MAELKAGDSFPEDVTFQWVPPQGDITVCGQPIPYKASEEAKKNKIIIVGVPGAFTPTCHQDHVPGYIRHKDELADKVDQVVVIASNDHWVMSAWGKANGISDEFIIFASDDGAKFSKSIGYALGDTGRIARFAIVVDHGKIVYVGKDEPKSLEASGVEGVLSKI